MNTDILNILVLTTIGGVLSLVGGLVFLFNNKLSTFLEKHSVSYAAGVLLTVALFGLLPEAFHEMGLTALFVFISAFVLIYFFERLFFVIHHHDEQGSGHKIKKSSSFFIVIGDTIHNFIDGVAIVSSYFVSPGLGIIATISTFLHEIPHEIGDFGILLKSNWSKMKVLLVNLLSSLATILGGLFVYFYAESEGLHGILMSISAGIFVYLGAIDFLPRIEENGRSKYKKFIPFVIGSLTILLIIYLIPHGH